jgi:hypothetical protein
MHSIFEVDVYPLRSRAARLLNRRYAPAWTAAALAVALLASAPAFAEHTRFWRESDYSEFLKGTAKGVALRSDGTLTPAPRFGEFSDPSVAYLLALATDSHGNLYAGGGSNAKVLRFDSKGHATSILESQELATQALAVDAHDNIYAGTAPDGKVYKIPAQPAGAKGAVFFDPKTKYIWGLAFDSEGILYVATGDTGEVFAVTPDGKGELFYKSDERHIRSLVFDKDGHLLLGTEPDGLIMRVEVKRQGGGKPPTAGSAFVIYETAGREVTSLVVDKNGNTYASSIGEKAPSVILAVPPQPAQPQISFTVTATGQQVATPVPMVQGTPFVPFPAVTGGSEVYRIAIDGSPEALWSSRSDLVYSLGFAPDGRLLLGTGNNGAIIQLDGDKVFSSLAKTTSQQVTALAGQSGGKVFLCTANPGKVFALGPDIEPEGTFESDTFDARIFSHWGRLTWWGQNVAMDGRVVFYLRSGNTSNPAQNWSSWAGPYTRPGGDEMASPPARFVQWKAVFKSSSQEAPSISWVSLAYLPKNVAPVVDSIVLQEPGVRVQSNLPQIMVPGTRPVQLRLPQPLQPGQVSSPIPPQPVSVPKFEPPPQGFAEKAYQSVVWAAHDDNDDDLVFSVYYRGETEKNWKLLKDDLHQTFYAWDTSMMPDGAYYLKIVASDAPSNPPSNALTAERISDRFEVDNTPPVIEGLRAEPASPEIRVRFEARDPSSTLSRAEYSLDAGEWKLVFPAGQLSDSTREHYELLLTDLAPGEHTLSVRVYNRFENSATAKVTFTTSAGKSKKG